MKYEHVIDDCGIYLLQNNILYKVYKGIVHKITTTYILSFEDPGLRVKKSL